MIDRIIFKIDRRTRPFRDLLPILGIKGLRFYYGKKDSYETYIDQLRSYVEIRTNSSDLYILREILAMGTYTFPTKILNSINKNGRYKILDFGANIGLAALKISHQLLTHGITDFEGICVEPDGENFRVLSNNVNSKFRNVNAALTSDRCRVEIKGKNSARSMSTLQTEVSENRKIRGSRPSAFLRLLGRSNQRDVIMKVDIEGAEKDLFERADDWVDRTLILFIEKHDTTLGVPFTKELELLDDKGFIPIVVYQPKNHNDMLFAHKSLFSGQSNES